MGKDGICNSKEKKISKSNLKQVIKIGHHTQDKDRVSSLERISKENCESQFLNDKTVHDNFNQDTTYKSYFPKRSASTVSISKDSPKAVFSINEEPKNESFKGILDVNDPGNSNTISARFSVDKEETKSIYRKN